MNMLLSSRRSHFEILSSPEVVLKNTFPRKDKCVDSLASFLFTVNYANLTTAFGRGTFQSLKIGLQANVLDM